jgi:diguanylate cyclase (GGDEF)-like protein
MSTQIAEPAGDRVDTGADSTPDHRERPDGLIGSRTIGASGRRDGPALLFVWRYVLLGNITAVAGAGAAQVYLLATPNGPHRLLLEFLLTISIVLNIAVALTCRPLIRSHWEAAFFYSWTAATLLVITAAAQLDGGLTSPLFWLLILPILWASINFPTQATAVAALAAMVAVAGLMALDHQWDGRAWFQLLFVLTFDVMAVAAAANRRAYEVAEAGLADRVTHDGLTGCLTNVAFYEHLSTEEARAQRTCRPFSLIIADADAFKELNDTQGHLVGDGALQVIARAIMSETRAADTVGRIGGDEFAILLPETPAEEARRVAERIRAAVLREQPPTTLSLGVATWSVGNEDSLAVVRRADRVMYGAKRRGGDRIAAR